MPSLVIAFPTLSQQDRQWMHQIRAQYDVELASVVAPHFTLVFPLVALEAKQLIEHVKAQVEHWQHIPFVLRCALSIKDALNEDTSVFLVPEEGFSALVTLHDALYRGVLAQALRLDIPFLPHITVGKTSDPWQAKALDVIKYEKMTVQTLERIPPEVLQAELKQKGKDMYPFPFVVPILMKRLYRPLHLNRI